MTAAVTMQAGTPPGVAPVSVLVARDAWLAELRTSGASRHTVRNYRSATDSAFAVFAELRGCAPGDVLLGEVSRDDVVAALARHVSYRARDGRIADRSLSTQALFYAALAAYFSYGVSSGKALRSPMVGVRHPRVPARVPKGMSRAECELLLLQARASRHPQRDTVMVLLGLTMGLRLAEMTALSLSSLLPDVEAPTHLRVVGKGDKERVVPVPQVVRDALAAYLPLRADILRRRGATASTLLLSQRARSGDMSASRESVGQVFDRLLRSAGLKQPGRRVHMARHSFATHVLASGADILSVSELLGHASVSTTQVYLKVDPSRLVAAVEASALARLLPGEDPAVEGSPA